MWRTRWFLSLCSGAAASPFVTTSWHILFLLPSLESQLWVWGSFVSTFQGCIEATRCAGAGCASQEPALGESFPPGLGLAVAQKRGIAAR